MPDDRNDDAIRAAARMRRYRARQRGDTSDDNAPRRPGRRPRRPVVKIPANPFAEHDMAGNFWTPVRYVVTALHAAGNRGATVAELTPGYRHTIASDLTRLRAWHGSADPEALLVDRAVSALLAEGQVRPARRHGAYRLAVPVDEVRHEGEPIVLMRAE